MEEGSADSLKDNWRIVVLWWGQLVISPLWAQELSFEHLSEIAKHTHTDSDKQAFLPNVSPGSVLPSLPCLPYRTTCLLAYLSPLHNMRASIIEGGRWTEIF
jgi:hypothetical protein